jgi:hypothetical protein
MIDLNDIANLRKDGTARKPQRCSARPRHVPGHAMPGFKIDQQKGGDCPDDGRTRTERKVQCNDQPARSQGAKLDWPTSVSVGFIFHRIGVSICHS